MVYIKIAICPGSFDPITNGHLDIVYRASKLFDKVVVLILNNAQKKNMFSIEQRLNWINASIKSLNNASVDYWSGLLVDYFNNSNACAIVKGIRSFQDFDYESQMSTVNKLLEPSAETIFLPADPEKAHITSTLVKNLYQVGGNIDLLIPKTILKDVKKVLEEVNK